MGATVCQARFGQARPLTSVQTNAATIRQVNSDFQVTSEMKWSKSESAGKKKGKKKQKIDSHSQTVNTPTLVHRSYL